MIWLFGEIWAWIAVGFLLGVAVGRWIWYRAKAPVVVEPAAMLRLRADLDAATKALARTESDLAAAINARKALESSLAAAGKPVKQLFYDQPDGVADDLTAIKGISPRLATLLNDIGIFHIHQIAGWTAADIAEIDARLGAYKGRIVRDHWVEQAASLLTAPATSDQA